MLKQSLSRGEPFRLVLLDNMMPEMDGFELAGEITRQPELAGATLMMISSADRREDAQRCKQAGVAAYMTKPIRRTELMDCLLRALEPAEIGDHQDRPKVRPRVEKSDRPLKILLAEDNQVNQMLAVRLLQKRGHEVSVAGNGKLALQALLNDQFDLVLMDVQMPEMDGFTATAAIRDSERKAAEKGADSHIPVIAMTAHAMKGDRERCLDAGMDDYISKPLKPAILFEMVERFAAMARQDQASPSEKQESNPTAIPSRNSLFDKSVFDREIALDYVSGDEELLADIISEFRNQYPRLLADIREAIASGDSQRLCRAAHTLKGDAGTLGAAAASALAERLETIGQRGVVDDAEHWRKQLEVALADLAEALTASGSP